MSSIDTIAADKLALEAGMALDDALYRRCRDASDETQDWPTGKVAR